MPQGVRCIAGYDSPLFHTLFPTLTRASLAIVCISNLRTLFPQDRNSYCDCPSPAHPHALRYGRSRQAPVYLASRTYGHCHTSRTGPREARSQRLHVAERSATEFIEILYTSTTPLHSSHCSTPPSYTPTGRRTGSPSVSETPGEHLPHV